MRSTGGQIPPNLVGLQQAANNVAQQASGLTPAQQQQLLNMHQLYNQSPGLLNPGVLQNAAMPAPYPTFEENVPEDEKEYVGILRSITQIFSRPVPEHGLRFCQRCMFL